MGNYFEIPPFTAVSELLHSCWQISRSNLSALDETIIPKGIIEIIFSLEPDGHHAELNNRSVQLPRCFIHGFHTLPIHQQFTRPQTFFGAVLYPAAARHFLKYQPAEFSNSIIDLSLVDPSFDALWQQLGEQKDFQSRVSIISAWLVQKLPQLSDRELAFNQFLYTNNKPALSVPELARHFCYSPRQLSRKLYELTGMNTEQLVLYKKYLQSVMLIHHSGLSLTEIAYTCGFSDQSHFIKTFRAFSSITPGEYRQKKGNVIGIF